MKRKRTNNSLKSSSSIETIPPPPPADLYLPNECWESICTFLIDISDDNNHLRYLEHISLASKQFLSITNHLRSSITICHPTLPFTPKTLFHRFPNLTSLHLTRFSKYSLRQISKFPFNLKSLKLSKQSIFPARGLVAFSKNITTLTSFTFSSKTVSLYNNHVVLISDCFPFLEELDLQCRFFGRNTMLTALPKLRKINLSAYDTWYTKKQDELFLNLCKNCEFIEEVKMSACGFLTSDGIDSAIRQRPTLRSLSFKWTYYDYGDISFSLVNLKGLTSLELLRMEISDEFLNSIAMEGLPLRRLVLQNCTDYSYAGIFSLLSNCQCIKHLDLQNAKFLDDQHVIELSVFLCDLAFINLSKCKKLTNSALLALVRNCLSLSDIKMECTRIGKNTVENCNSSMDFVLHPQLKSLYLGRSYWLKDESLVMFASIFPNLQILDLRQCYVISEEGICQVLRRCCKIRHLNLFKCNVKLLKLNFEIPKLEVLNLSNTSVDDETLYVISKNCCRILQLLLEGCKNVTTKGVKHVVLNCTQLREIHLQHCNKVCADIVEDMVRSRPSLRKIIAPPCFRFNYKNQELFWHCGCLVFKKNW